MKNITNLTILFVSILFYNQIKAQTFYGKYVLDNTVFDVVSDKFNNTYVGGNFNKIGIYSGSSVNIDSTTSLYDTNFVKVNGPVNAVISIPSGGWYVAGSFSNVNGITRNNLARINSDGTLHSFNPSINNIVYCLALDASNNLYVGGIFSGVGASIARSRLAKYDNTGNLTSFNPTFNGDVHSICIDGSSNLYVGGNFTTVGGTTTRNRLAKFNSSGVLQTFNPDINNIVLSICSDVSNNIYVGGQFTTIGGSTTRNYLAKFDATGTLTTFNPNLNNYAYCLVTDASSNLYVGGSFTTVGGITRNRLAKLDALGTLLTFNPNVNSIVKAIAINNAGALYIGGSFTLIGGVTSRKNLAKLDAAGNVASFNPNPNNSVNAIALNNTSSVYVGGYFDVVGNLTTQNYIAKFDISGNLTSFNPNPNLYIYALAIDTAANLYIGGAFTTISSTARSNFAKYSSTGVLSSFNPSPNNSVYSIALDSRLNLYLGGNFTTIAGGTTRNRLAKFNSSGTLLSFDPNVNLTVSAMAVDKVNNLYIGGNFTTVGGTITRNHFAKYDSTGVLNSFDPNFNGSVNALLIDSFSNLFVGGSFTSVAGSITRNRLAKYDLSNTLTSFNPNLNNVVNDFTIDKKNNLYIAGDFTNVGGSINRSRIAKYTSSGILTSYSPSVISSINAINLILDTTLQIGGTTFFPIPYYDYTTVIPCTPKSDTISVGACNSYLFNGNLLHTNGTYYDTLLGSNDCDSFLILRLTILDTTSGSINRSICVGTSYLFNGINRTTAGSYRDTLIGSNGCDSFLTLILTIRPSSNILITQTICSGNSYLFNGINRTTAGFYQDTLTDINGCDSFLILNLIIRPTSSGSINQIICSGIPYIFNGINRTTSGTYLDTLIAINGCDSFVTLNLTVRPTTSGTINQSICGGTSYLFNGINRTTTGTYLDTLSNYVECDSFLTLNLTVRPRTLGSISQSICGGTSYLFNGVNLTAAGTYLDTLTNFLGCDSFLTLNLTVRPRTLGSISQSICTGSSYLFNGINRTTAGTYLDTLIGSNGCDSFLTLNLTVRPTTTGTINQSICAGGSYLFNGINRTTAGTYRDTLVGSNGCDSFLTLNLTVRPTTTGNISQSICAGGSYLFNGINRTTAGTYRDTLVGSNGCDSFLTLNLTVRPTTTGTINQSICAGGSYLFNGINRTTAGTYRDTLVGSNGCDSFLTLNLTVRPTTTGTISQSICAGGSYLFNGINRTTAGTYRDTLIGSNGCDSFLTLNLTVRPTTTGTINQSICAGGSYLFNGINRTTAGTYRDTLIGSNGCDSFLTLNLTVRPTTTGTINQSICAGGSYLFNGINRTTAGTYLDTLIGSNGCDSFLTLNLTVRPTTTGTINQSICAGGSYLFNGINRTTAGTYRDTLVGSNGCDSFLTLNLTVRPTTTGTISQSICAGGSYLFNGINRTTAGTYRDTLIGSNGCDSFLTLNLTVRPTTTGTINQSICAGGSYLFNGINRTTAGTYRDTLVGSNGCDSFLTLNLTIRPTTTGTINQSICAGGSYLFNGINRTTAGTYRDTLVGSNGCDSFLTLNLTVRPTTTGTINQSICAGGSYLFNGINRTTAGTYRDTLVGSNGCDSFLTLNLTVRPTTNGTINQSICAGGSYLFNGINRTTAGTYRDTLIGSNGCDSFLTLNLTVRPTTTGTINQSICAGGSYLFNGINRTTAGTYRDTLVGSNGCDSFLTLNLTVVSAVSGTISQSICAGSSYLFNGINRTTSGTYRDTLIGSNGCDSFLTLNLTVVSAVSGTISQSICAGGSYLFNGINRTTSGTYLDTLIGSNGCDSFLTLNLTVRPTTTGTINQSICAGGSYLFNGINRTTAGTYRDTLIGSNGCDSFLTLNLTVRPTTTGTINQSICAGGSYLFNGINRTTAGTYRDTLVGSNGCDSFLTLNLTVRPTTTGNISQSICAGGSYLFNGINRTTAGTYRDTLVGSNGCDSFLTLNLTVRPTTTGTINQSICAGGSYLFNGINRTTAGTYRDTLVGSNGCDSFLTLNLTVVSAVSGTISQSICTGSSYLFNGINRTTSGTYNDTLVASGGCDSFLTLILTVRPTTTGTINQSICAGGSYLFNGINRTTAGTYRDTLVGSNGCDSFLTLNLTVVSAVSGTISQSICAGGSYLFNGINRTTAGTYRDTLVGSNGCDSFLTLNLTVRPTTTGTISQSICAGGSYLFNGINRTTAGTYNDTLVASGGCDSFLTLILTVRPTTTGTINQSICAGGSYLFNGINRTTAGTYRDTLVGSNGCDSFLTLNLTIRPTTTGIINQSICAGGSYLFNGINRTTAGTYRDTLVGSNGCDSFLTLNLTVVSAVSGTISQSICAGGSYLFNGINRTTSGTYNDTLVASGGCDSFLTLILTVRPTTTGTINQSICAGGSYLFNGINRTTAGTYRDTLIGSNGCDSFLTLNLTVLPAITDSIHMIKCIGTSYLFNGNTITTTGIYYDTLRTNNNCDSIIKLFIEFKDCNAIQDNFNNLFNIQLYPNPVEDILTIQLELLEESKFVVISIIDLKGKIIYDNSVLIGEKKLFHKINLSDYSSGIYLLKIENEQTKYIQKILLNK